MFEALKLLDLNTAWSGYYNELRGPWCDYLLRTHVDPPFHLLRGFDGAMDEPFHLIYKEVLQAMPEAKFVYTEADPDRWYDSYMKLYDEIGAFHLGGILAPKIKEPRNRTSALQVQSNPLGDVLSRIDAQFES